MMELLRALQAIVAANPVLQAMAGTTVVGAILFQLRAMPGRVLAFIEHQFVLTLTAHDEEPTFGILDLWLAEHPATKRVRNLQVTYHYERNSGRHTIKTVPGAGRHLLWEKHRPWLVHRKVNAPGTPDGSNAQSVSGKRTQSLTISTFGRDPKAITELLERLTVVFTDGDRIAVQVGDAGIRMRAKRSMDTVYLPEAQKRRVIDDVQWFLSAQDWYTTRGIPYRRGYLLEGPPGTGKTTLIFAVASLLGRGVRIINPATIDNDAALHYQLNEAGDSIIVIEDADSVKAVRDRALIDPNEAPTQAGKGLTLSGFLNAIDGLGASEGRLLFVTTNEVGVLDPAFFRPGRLDVIEHIGLADMTQALAMFRAWHPHADDAAFRALVAPRLPLAPAAVQSLLLEFAGAGIVPGPGGAANAIAARCFERIPDPPRELTSGRDSSGETAAQDPGAPPPRAYASSSLGRVSPRR